MTNPFRHFRTGIPRAHLPFALVCGVVLGIVAYVSAPYAPLVLPASIQETQAVALTPPARSTLAAARVYEDTQSDADLAAFKSARAQYQVLRTGALRTAADKATADTFVSEAERIVSGVEAVSRVQKVTLTGAVEACTLASGKLEQIQKNRAILASYQIEIDAQTKRIAEAAAMVDITNRPRLYKQALEKEVLVGILPDDIQTLEKDIALAEERFKTAESRLLSCAASASAAGECDTQYVTWLERMIDVHDLYKDYEEKNYLTQDTLSSLTQLESYLAGYAAKMTAAHLPAPEASPATTTPSEVTEVATPLPAAASLLDATQLTARISAEEACTDIGLQWYRSQGKNPTCTDSKRQFETLGCTWNIRGPQPTCEQPTASAPVVASSTCSDATFNSAFNDIQTALEVAQTVNSATMAFVECTGSCEAEKTKLSRLASACTTTQQSVENLYASFSPACAQRVSARTQSANVVGMVTKACQTAQSKTATAPAQPAPAANTPDASSRSAAPAASTVTTLAPPPACTGDWATCSAKAAKTICSDLNLANCPSMQSLQETLRAQNLYAGMNASCSNADGKYGSCTRTAVAPLYAAAAAKKQSAPAPSVSSAPAPADGITPASDPAQNGNKDLQGSAGKDGIIPAADTKQTNFMVGGAATPPPTGSPLVDDLTRDKSYQTSDLSRYTDQAKTDLPANASDRETLDDMKRQLEDQQKRSQTSVDAQKTKKEQAEENARVAAGNCAPSNPLAAGFGMINGLLGNIGLNIGNVAYKDNNIAISANLGGGKNCIANAVLNGPGAQAGLTAFKSSYTGNKYGSAVGMIVGWINFALGFLFIIAFAALVYAGFLYVTAAANSGNADTAKQIILWVVIGIIIIFSAYAIVNTFISANAST